MRGQPLFLTLFLATLTCAILAGCTEARTTRAARSTTVPPAQPPASNPHATSPPGIPGIPLVLSCYQQAWPGPQGGFHARPGDLVIGPPDISGGKALATMTPAEHGYGSYGPDGRFYKVGLALAKGATVTVTIGASARGHVVIAAGPDIVSSTIYYSCLHQTGLFAQGFAFTRPPLRGCVPLDVTVDDRPPVHHVTLSLFAGSCAT